MSERELEPTWIRMQHTTLAEEISVHPLAVPHHEQAGWQVVAGQDADYEQWPAEQQRFEGQQQVRMHHPDIAQDIIVAASAVPHHRSKGWLISDPEVAAHLEAEAKGASGLEAKTVPQLQELLKARDLPVSGTKPELIERLQQSEQDEAGVEPAPDNDKEA